jgi:hypothetical protein
VLSTWRGTYPEVSAFQRSQVVVAITDQLLHAGRRRAIAAIEQGDFVAAIQRLLHHVRTDEAGAA